jgi:anti-anti-sigma regulatory factor
MFRVTPFQDRQAYRLQVEGRLSGAAELEVLRQALAEAASLGRRVVVDLSGLRFADEHAVALLAAVRGRGVELAGCSPWLASLLWGGR